jgi:hypothetical protein
MYNNGELYVNVQTTQWIKWGLFLFYFSNFPLLSSVKYIHWNLMGPKTSWIPNIALQILIPLYTLYYNIIIKNVILFIQERCYYIFLIMVTCESKKFGNCYPRHYGSWHKCT